MVSRSNRSSVRPAVPAAGLLANAAAFAQVTVQGAWVHGAVPGQTSSSTFMALQSADGAKVVGVTTPVAGMAKIHEMKVEGDVIRMHVVPSLELSKGQAVQLRPGGYHVVLMDLERSLAKDVTVPLTLRVELTSRRVVRQEVEARVRDLTVGDMPAMNRGDEHKH